MRFHILGPVQVRGEDGRACRLDPRQRRLLAVLLLSGNEVVARPALIDALWDDRPPATAGRQMMNCASALRRRLVEIGVPPAVLTAAGTGYRIRVDGGELDAHEFAGDVDRAQRLAEHGQAGDAVQVLRSALALWRGAALADCPGRIFEAAAARLDEQHLQAVELCVDLQLQQGKHAEVVAELTELVAAHPLRERLVGLLMLALHRCGRRADALATYQRLRSRLTDGLGLDPGAALRQLHTAILRGQTGTGPAPVDGPAAVPRQLPASVRHFVGRGAELKELTRLLDEQAGAGTVVISAIDGTAGIGKTALALLWAHQVAPRFPDGQLHLNLRGYGPTGAPMSPADAIRSLLDGLAVPAGTIPPDVAAQAALYRTVLADRRMLIVLDNARDVEQVRPLLPGSAGCLVVVTSRSQLTGLVAADGAHPLTLDLLSTAEAYDLLARHLGQERIDAYPLAVDDLIALCGRLPLALAIAAARAAAQPTFPLTTFAAELADTRHRLDALDAGDPGTQLRAVFSWSYQQVSEPAARLFRHFGVHPGPDLSPPAAASLAGLPLPRLRPLLAELTRAHLVVEHTPGRFTLHDLLRAYAAELADSAGDRAAATGRMLSHYLYSTDAADRVLYPHAAALPLPDRAPDVTPEEVAGHDQALAWFEAEHQVLLSVIASATDAAYDRHVWQLAWNMGHYVQTRKHWRDWVTALGVALTATVRFGNPDWLAYIHRALGFSYVQLDQLDLAYHHGRQSLELSRSTGDRASEAQAQLTLADVSERRGRYADALDHARQALDLYRQIDHEGGQAVALNAVGWCLVRLDDHPQAVDCCRQALAVQQRLGNVQGQAETWDSLGYAYHHLGEHGEAATCYRESAELFHALGDRHLEALTLDHLGDTQHAGGDPQAARATWREALTILDGTGDPDAEQVRAKLHSGS